MTERSAESKESAEPKVQRQFAELASGEFPAYVVTENVWDSFLPYRHLKPVSAAGKTEKPSRDTVIEEMERFGYLRINAVREVPRGERSQVVIFILATEGKYAHQGPQLASLLRGLDGEKETKKGALDEVILIAEAEFFKKSFLMSVLAEFRTREARPPDAAGLQPVYSAHPYHVFALVVPEHASVPRYRVMPDEEAQEFLTTQRIEPRNIPPISYELPPIVWLGARPGQFVEVERDSENAAVAICVRLVTR